jgi:hypothetical protein
LLEKVQGEPFDLQRKGGYLMKNISGHCPVCRSKILEGGTNCPSCETPHHKECWEYNGKCAIFACRGKVIPDVTSSTPAFDAAMLAKYKGLHPFTALFLAVLPLLALVMTIISTDKRTVSKGEVVVRDNWSISQSHTVFVEGDSYYPLFYSMTHYKVRSSVYFSTPVPFSDGIMGNMSGVVEYELPDSLNSIERLHCKYDTQSEINQKLIWTEIHNTLLRTGRMMTSVESYGDRGAKFQRLFSDQMHKGPYVVMLGDGIVTNPITKQDLRIETVYAVTRSDGSFIRDIPRSQGFGITIIKASVDIGYPQEFLDVMYENERAETEHMREAQEARMKRRANRKIIADALKYLQTFF